jgi:hypothetical protein
MTTRQSPTAPTFVLAGLVAASLLASGTVAACDADPAGYSQYVGVCVNQVTQQRVPDGDCGLYANGAAVAVGYTMDYVDLGLYPSFRVPAYGSRFNGTNVTVVHNVQNNVTVYRNVPSGGGVASSLTSRATMSRPGTATSGGGGGASNQGTVNSSVQRGGFGVPSAAGGSRLSGGS